MNKWLVGLTCVVMGVASAMGALTSPATLPVEYAGASSWSNAALDAMTGWDATGLGAPYTGAGASAKFDGAGDNVIIYFDSAPGEIVYSLRRSDGTAITNTYEAKVQESTSTNSWTDVRTFNGSEFVGSLVTFTNTLSSASRYVRFIYSIKASGQNLGWGYVKITAGGAPVYGVSFDKTNGFTVDQGSSSTITATAANGTAPYTYAWTSALGGTDYSTNAGVFTILATAATGSYSATVVASDSALQNVTNSINFSVVPLATKYAITITAPTNGTVTTTPTNEASAGAPVTVNATGNTGYVVGTITVVGADTTPVTVTGNTFTMPAQAVTVTVAFQAVVAEGIVDFRFNTVPYLQVTAKDANLTVSNMTLTAGTIDTAITTGTYFPDEPYVEETGGWTNSTQAGAKAFLFTITPAGGTSVTIDSISFRAYATASGPSAFGFDVGGGMSTYEVNAPDSSLLVVSQAVVGVVSQTGAIVVKIQGWANGSRTTTGAGVFRLDDVVIHGSVSTGPVVLGVILNRTNGFVVEQGTSNTITATAANGTAPYSYTWSSTLGSGSYSTNANLFTILATAPVGVYTSTVVATDSSGPVQSATNAVTFAVVAPYAITITPPTNGTVTTTPASNAMAGTSVTINPTPSGGYRVASITVVGADTTPVTVTGETFTMPAQAVVVTVLFEVYVAPDALITFETATLPAAYTNNTATLEDGKVWSTIRVVRGNVAGSDKMIGTNSARLYPVTGTNAVLQLTEAYTQAITKISFSVGSYGSDSMANVVLTAEVSSNGTSWEVVNTLSNAAGITTILTEHVVDTIPAGSIYLRFVASAAAASNKRLNVDNIGLFFGGASSAAVVVSGSRSGTVGVALPLTITLTNSATPASSWTIDLRDPTNGVTSNSFNEGTGAFSFTPAQEGAYSLTATALDAGAGLIAATNVTLTVSAVAANPPITSITLAMDLTGDFTFTVPPGYNLVRVEGASTTLDVNGQFIWLTLTAGVGNDYTVSGSTIRILSAASEKRMIRIWVSAIPG